MSSGVENLYYQRLLYLLELKGDGIPGITVPLLLGPSQYSRVRRFSQQVTISQDGGVHVFEAGAILSDITMTIETGAQAANLEHIKDEGRTSLTGYQRYKLVETLILDKYSEYKQNPRYQNVKMILHVLKDQESYVVVPTTWTRSRQAGQPLASHPYTIAFIDVGDATWEVNSALVVNESLLDQLRGGVGALRAVVQGATAALGAVNRALQSTLIIEQGFANILNDIDVFLNAVSDCVTGITTVIRFPYTAVLNFADQIDRWRLDLGDRLLQAVAGTPLESGLVDMLDSLGLLQDGIERIACSPTQFSTTPANKPFATYVPSGVTQPTWLDAGEPTGWAEVLVTAADTPAGLAARYGVEWGAIAAANQLQAPYISEAFLPGTVGPGDRIIVPTPNAGAPIATAYRGSPSGSSQQETLFGVDVRRDAVEGLALADGGLDTDLVAGRDNAIQAVHTLVETPFGTDGEYPGLGSRLQPGDGLSLEGRLLGRYYAEAAVRRDPRVKTVAAQVTISGDTTYVAMDAVLRDDSVEHVAGPVLT